VAKVVLVGIAAAIEVTRRSKLLIEEERCIADMVEVCNVPWIGIKKM
jgi:hypothetical protein